LKSPVRMAADPTAAAPETLSQEVSSANVQAVSGYKYSFLLLSSTVLGTSSTVFSASCAGC
jgi:hypothetical protein